MKKHREIIPSMLQDIRNGKECEIYAINGIVSEYGQKYNVKTPINDRIVEVVCKEMKHEINTDLKNLDLFQDLFQDLLKLD
ncbi:MAG: ketopantoate reductase family protein [Anaeroplasma sp.]